jgi:hypothetical protein
MLCADVNRAAHLCTPDFDRRSGSLEALDTPGMIFASLTLAVIEGIFPPFPALVNKWARSYNLSRSLVPTRKQPV